MSVAVGFYTGFKGLGQKVFVFITNNLNPNSFYGWGVRAPADTYLA